MFICGFFMDHMSSSQRIHLNIFNNVWAVRVSFLDHSSVTKSQTVCPETATANNQLNKAKECSSNSRFGAYFFNKFHNRYIFLLFTFNILPWHTRWTYNDISKSFSNWNMCAAILSCATHQVIINRLFWIKLHPRGPWLKFIEEV